MAFYRFLILLIAFCVVLCTDTTAQRVIYIDINANGLNTGNSWDDAYIYLQDALIEAKAGDELWVAAGTYKPDQGATVEEGDRSASFIISSGISLYGGFQGRETERDNRDWLLNRTILSGDLMMNDTDSVQVNVPSRAENSYQIVSIIMQSEEITIDGFEISSGNAYGPIEAPDIANAYAGGLYVDQAHITLRNLSIERNAAYAGGGGAIIEHSEVLIEDVIFKRNNASGRPGAIRGGGLVLSSQSTGVLRNVDFIQNTAIDAGGMFNSFNGEQLFQNVNFIANKGSLGGGLYNFDSDPFIMNSLFLGNEAYEGGGGMANERSAPVLMNVVFSGNRVVGSQFFGGGGLLNYQSSSQIINCVFSMNRAEKEGGAIYNLERDTILVANSILWGNIALDDSQIYNMPRLDQVEYRSTTDLSHSLFGGMLTGGTIDLGGNVSLEPLFVNPTGPDGVAGTEDDDLRIQPGSPAIDAGSNMALPLDFIDADLDGDVTEPFSVDLDYNLRILNGALGANDVDMGAYEWNAPPFNVSTEGSSSLINNNELEVLIYPNPAKNQAELQVSTSSGKLLSISIHDLLGRHVATIFEGIHNHEGVYQLALDRFQLASGIYFVHIRGEGLYKVHNLIVAR